MYTEEDLDYAVGEGIFTEKSVKEFRNSVSSLRNSPSVDEENFKLIGGFNDIFIVIACSLLLFSFMWVLKSSTDSTSIGLLGFSVLSWGLAEFFVLKRKMALPAIVLLLSFVGGIFALTMSVFEFSFDSDSAFALSAGVSAGSAAIAALIHWKRFKVPITISAGCAAAVVLLVSMTVNIFPSMKDSMIGILFICGLLSFAFAMYWDSSDTKRTTYRSDAAFWLHLLSAPLIIHPIFTSLGVLDGNENVGSMAVVVVLYIVMTAVSVVIDRRALMVSSLVYVIVAFTGLIEAFGGVGYSFAITGVFMGGLLLILSAFWHQARRRLVVKLPDWAKNNIPKIKVS